MPNYMQPPLDYTAPPPNGPSYYPPHFYPPYPHYPMPPMVQQYPIPNHPPPPYTRSGEIETRTQSSPVDISDSSLLPLWKSWIKIVSKDQHEEELKQLCDSSPKLATLLQNLGPETVPLLKTIVSANFFYGFLEAQESKKFLQVEEIGTFLLRFSGSQPFCMVIDYVSAQDSVNSVLIRSAFNGIEIDKKVFPTVTEAVEHYKQWLVKPFTSDLPRSSCFHGSIDAEKAKELLNGKPQGTFLLRFSSMPGCYAWSYVAENGTLKGLVKRNPIGPGFVLDGDDVVYKSVLDFVQAYQKANVFGQPLQRPSS
jgi:hypothetical protein